MRFSLILAAALAAVPLGAQSGSDGTITIFREKANSVWSSLSSRNVWPGKAHVKMTLDGLPLIDMHAKSFASFTVPAGRHIVEFARMGSVSASFELKPGERVFIRPGFVVGLGNAGNPLTVSVLPCEEALSLGKESDPLPAKFVEREGVSTESRFPATC